MSKLLLLLPGGLLLYAAYLVLRHRHDDVLSRHPDTGIMGFRCKTCDRWRMHPWHAPELAKAGAQRTGIERHFEDEAREKQTIDAALADMEKQEQRRQIAANVRGKYDSIRDSRLS